MTKLVLNLTKPGDSVNKLSLNLNKGELFVIRLSWEGQTDLDLHALHCVNKGAGAKLSSAEDILSPYNTRRKINNTVVGLIEKNSDGTFSIHGGAYSHSADATDGDKAEIDEWIKVDPTKISCAPGEVIEVPLISMIHPQSGGKTFRDVRNAVVAIQNSAGRELMRAALSDQFGEFVGVQMGSIMIDTNGPVFAPVGVGFNGDFNSVLEHFS